MRSVALSLLPVLLCTAPAMAQVQCVDERALDNLKPLGVKAGAFMLSPALETDVEYNDNIYARPHNETSDVITRLKPSLGARTSWSRHAIKAYAKADIGLYADNSDENYTDNSIGMKARYDITHQTYLDTALDYTRTHEERDSPNDVNGDEPTEIHIKTARLKFTRALAKIKLYLHGELQDIDFENVAAGGTVIDNGFRNRLQKEAGIKLAYELMPQSEIFAKAVYDARDYEVSSVPDRSSEGFRLQMGYSRDITGKLKGDLYGGYIAQNYGAGYKDISAADYGASLLWNASALTSLKAEVKRGVFETITPGVSGYIRTRGDLGIEHAFRENIIAKAGAAYARDRYVGLSRDDDIYKGTIGLGYKPRRGLETEIGYTYDRRDSSRNAQDYDAHRFMIRARYGL